MTVRQITRGQEAIAGGHHIREQRQTGSVQVATAGACTMHVKVSSADYPGRQVLLGTPQPALIDRTRLLTLAVLLALSVLTMLRPRRWTPVPQ